MASIRCKRWVIPISVLIISALFYWVVNKAIDRNLSQKPEVIEQGRIEVEKSDISSARIDLADDFHGEVDVSEASAWSHDEFVQCIRDFLYEYRTKNPKATPIVSGQLDAFGNVWSCVMRNGDGCEIILMRYDSAHGEAIRRIYAVSKKDFEVFHDTSMS